MRKRWWALFAVPAMLAIALFAVLRLPVFGAHPSDADRERFTASSAFDAASGTFENRRPELYAAMRSEGASLGMAAEWFAERPRGRPADPLPQRVPDLDAFLAPSAYPRVIWFGHSTFLLNLGGTLVLVDPVFSEAAAPVSFVARRFQPPVLPLDALPHIDIVLISHDHYDHLDMASIRVLAGTGAEFVVPLGVGAHLDRWGVPAAMITERDWWQGVVSHGIEFTAAPAQHFSGRNGIDENETLWASWAIARADTRLYFSGDSGYDVHFAEIGERLGPFDVAFLENGQYDDAWPQVHMRPFETLRAHEDLGAAQLLPVHWGMFELAFHDWDAPVVAITELATAAGVDVLTPMIGGVLVLDGSPHAPRWWE